MNEKQRYVLGVLDTRRKAAFARLGGSYAEKLPGTKEPQQVKQARRQAARFEAIVSRWRAQQRRRHQEAQHRLQERLERIRKEVYFGDPQKALRMLETIR